MDWMAWTLPTALFFAGIAALLVLMTLWELASPSGERRGYLPISTTRGDRLFIGLLGSAYIHLILVGLTDWSSWIATVVSLLGLILIIKWG